MNPPLAGIRVIEFEGLGPGPLAGRMLADMGAQVTVIARPTRGPVNARFSSEHHDPLARGKTIVTLDLKQAVGLAGLLSLSGRGGRGGRGSEPPSVPPTVVGDAAGALGLAFGVVCAMLEARTSGHGRVVDGAVIDVLAMLGTIAQWIRASGQLDGEQPSPFHDSPFYDVYACADGNYVTVGALEPQFYALLLNKLGLTDVDPAAQYHVSTWPALKQRFVSLFASQPRAHWCALLEGSDACFAPVLTLAEAAVHPHNVARGIYRVDAHGGIEVAGAPRFFML